MGLFRHIKDIVPFFSKKAKGSKPKVIAILLGGIFIAFLGGIIFKNQLLTFFSNAGSESVAYWKLDEGQGTTVYDASGNNINASLDIITQIPATNGGPVNIDNASDFGALPWGSRQVVRTSAGTLYAAINDGGSCEVWKSSDGSTWSEQDSSNNPTCTSGRPISVAVDSSDILHVTYINGASAKYITFATSSDSFGSEENIYTLVSAYGPVIIEVVIALDSADKPHVALRGDTGTYSVGYYTNKVSGSWKSVVSGPTISDFGNYGIDIAINSDDIPVLVSASGFSASIYAKIGNVNDASSFTSKYLADTNTSSFSLSLGIDTSGNVWVAYSADSTSYISLFEHSYGDAWTTWQSAVTNSNVGIEPSVAISGTDIYVFYEDDNDDIVYDIYNGSTWDGETTLQTGTFQDVHAKWSYLNDNQASTQIDYLYSDNTDAYWASLGFDSVGAGTGPTWQSEDLCISGKCLYFDGTDDYMSAGSTVSTVNSVSFWMKPISTTGSIVDLDGSADITMSGGTLSAGFTSPTIYVNGVVSSSVQANEWQYVSVTTSSAISDSTPIIGKIDSSYFKGFIDEIKFYDYARTAAQIKADYAARATVRGVSASFGDDDLSRKLSNGLVGYWKMDEVGVSGANWTAVDSSGNNNNGTGVGNASVGTTAPGKFGNGGYFDGNGDYILLNSEISLGSVHTICAWANPSSSDIGSIVAKESTSEYALKFYGASSRIYYRVAGNSYFFSYTVDDQLHYFCQVRDNDTLKTYRDAQLISTLTGLGSDTLTIDRIGRDDGSTEFNGIIDELRIYNRALDPSEVQALYNWSPGPVGYWKFEEKSGSSAIDSSGNGNNCTLSSMSANPWIQGKYGTALDFNKTDDIANCGSGSSLDQLPSLTVSAWIKPRASSSYEQIVAKATSATPDNGWLFESNMANNTLEFWADYSSQDLIRISSNNVITDDEWQYVTVTWDGSATATGINMYVNGIEVSYATTTNATGTKASDASANLTIGNDINTGDDFDGAIDDVKVYDYVRTSAQIIQDMNAGHPIGGSPVGSELMYWKMDEGYGDFAYDYGTAENDLFLAGGDFCPGDAECPTWTNDGKFGKALSFDGGDYMEAGTAPGIDNNGTGEYTATIWFKSSTNPSTYNYGLMGIISTGAQDRFIQVTSGGLPRFYVYDGAERYATGSTIVTDGQWHHLGGVFDGTTIYMYVDGVLEASTATTGSEDHTNPYIRFSHEVASYYERFTGTIDEARIYTVALTADQMKIDYNRGEAQVMGAGSTGLGGTSPSYSDSREYCVPGDSTTCNGPLAEWLFNENIGRTVQDTSENANTGTLSIGNSQPTWVKGKFGRALNFNGSTQHISVPDDNSMDFGTSTAFTISAWVTKNSTSYANLFHEGQEEGGVGDASWTLNFQNSLNRMRFIITSDTWNFYCGIDGNTNIADSKWHHVGVVVRRNASCSTSDIDMYVDGRRETLSLIYSAANTNVNLDNNDPFTIGAYLNNGAYSNYWDGKIDQVRIYGYARTAAQMNWEYNQGKPILYYPLDECTGTFVYNHSKNGNGDFISMDGTIDLGAGGTTSAGTCSTSGAWADGASGKIEASMSFDNNDDIISTPDSVYSDFPEGTDFSVSAWIKIPSLADNNVIFAKKLGNSAGQAGFMTYVNSSGQIASYISDGTDQVNKFTNTTITAGTWYYITMVYRDDTSLTMYINGKDGGGSLVGTIANVDAVESANDFAFGAESDGGLPFSGQIDEVKIYNYALTTTQMKTELNDGAVRFQ